MNDDRDLGMTENADELEVPARSGLLAVWVLPIFAPIAGLIITGYLFQTCLAGRSCLMYLYFWPYSFIVGGMLWAAGLWYREKNSMSVYLLPIITTLVVLWYLWRFQQYFLN